MAIVPAPVVMKPVFSPTATWVSFSTFIVSTAVMVLALPGSIFNDFHVPPETTKIIMDFCLVITTVAGGHLSVSRSLLPSVDNPK